MDEAIANPTTKIVTAIEKLIKSFKATFIVSNKAPNDENLSVIILNNLKDKRKNKNDDTTQNIFCTASQINIFIKTVFTFNRKRYVFES